MWLTVFMWYFSNFLEIQHAMISICWFCCCWFESLHANVCACVCLVVGLMELSKRNENNWQFCMNAISTYIHLMGFSGIFLLVYVLFFCSLFNMVDDNDWLSCDTLLSFFHCRHMWTLLTVVLKIFRKHYYRRKRKSSSHRPDHDWSIIQPKHERPSILKIRI